MKILVFGKTGQVAQSLLALADDGLVIEALGREVADLEHPETCVKHIEATDADVVINAAAFTGVDAAETEAARAEMVNAIAPGEMAVACAKRALPFLHISTDYVFGGQGATPYCEGDRTAPQNTYGRTKHAGEQAVIAANGRHVVLRTSWVFSAYGRNFVKTMLTLSGTHSQLDIVDDQVGGPTFAGDIAAALVAMAHQMTLAPSMRGGLYHFAGAPSVSWAEFAREIFEISGRKVDVRAIPSTDYPTPATRPLNSRLDSAKIHRDFQIGPSDWRAGLRRIIAQLEQV